MAIMTSYNQNNGRPAADDYDLCTAFARDEWGFKGMIMTDWGGGQSVPMYEMHAGNDLVCPGKGAASIITAFKNNPDWNGKGYVNMTTISWQDENYETQTKEVPNFGGYELNKNGETTVSTSVTGDADANHDLLCEEAWQMIDEEYATYKVEEVNSWGGKRIQTTVTYKVNQNKDLATNKQLISLGDLQKAAINICNFIMSSTEFATAHGFEAKSLNSVHAAILKDITSYSKDAVQTSVAIKGLEGMINKINSLDASDYTEESWNAVQDAIAAARNVVTSENATQAQIDAAVDALIAAFGNLEYGAQTLHLEVALDAAEEIIAASQNYDSLDALKAAVAEAKAVLAEKSATQDQINAAAVKVLAEINKLTELSDVTSLGNLINAAKDLLNGNYTSDSLEALNNAIAKAEEVLTDSNRKADAIEKAYADLIEAIANLELKGNKAALKAMLDKAAEILAASDTYLASTIDGLAAVKADAQNVYDSADADQDAIDAAVRALTLKVANARLIGDVNGDGKVNTSDSVSVLRASVELDELDTVAAASADVNGDGVVDTQDAVLILQQAAEK